jgi:hypothetical protein
LGDTGGGRNDALCSSIGGVAAPKRAALSGAPEEEIVARLVEALPGEGHQARIVQLFRQARLRLLIAGDAARRDAPRRSDDRARNMDRQPGTG